MIELPLEYMNKVANQTILISALLGGFSLAVLATLMDSKANNRMVNRVFRIATLSSALFLIAIFSMTNILMRTTEGFPFQFESSELIVPRIIGTLSFFLGIISLLVMVALSGWIKSRRMGRYTTGVGIISMILIIWMVT